MIGLDIYIFFLNMEEQGEERPKERGNERGPLRFVRLQAGWGFFPSREQIPSRFYSSSTLSLKLPL